MDVVSTSVLPVAAVRWSSPSGAPALTVVCRATFALQPIASRLAEEQDPIAAADVYPGQDPRRSLQIASDLVPHKARPEVILVGHAYAPRGQPVRSVIARLAIGAVDKSVEVMPDRWLTRDGELREGAPWTRRALSYEGAAVGATRGNPAGMAFDAEDPSGARPLPYLQPKGAHVARRGDTFDTACFGPIAPTWPQRAALAPRLGAHWAQALAPDRPLPEDVDPAFFNCAPPDQHLDAIRGDERILLEHLHPRHARLLTSLPGLAPRAEIARLGRPKAPLALACDTIWIDTDRATCALVFRATVLLAYPGEPGCVTVHLDVPDATDDAADVRTMAPLEAHLAAMAPFPIAESGAPRAAGSTSALPFHATVPLGAAPLGALPLGAPPPVVPPALVAPPPDAAASPPPPAIVHHAPALVSASMAAIPPPPPILSTAPDATPWAVPVAATPPQVGSIGQRLAMEQAIAEADATREARPAPDLAHIPHLPHLPHLAPLPAVEPETTGLPASSPSPLADAAGTPAVTDEPAEDAPAETGREVVVNLYSDTGLLDALKRDRRFRERLEAIESEAGDDEPLARIDEEDPGLIASLLARAEPSSPAALRAALRAAVRGDGRLDCPIEIVEGSLACSFDPRESLRALASAALSVDPDDEELARPVAAARAALSDGALPAALAARLETAIHAAFRAKDRALSPRELSAATSRALVEQRAFARRDVLDGPHVRAELTCGDAPKLVVYLPEAAARALPLVRRLRARLLVEVRPREDDHEACPIALRARAISRLSLIPAD